MPDVTPQGYQRWCAGEGSPIIEYSCAVMDHIRALVVEGLHRLSRGGIEVGGLLLGTRSDRRLRIESQRPIECEHARGPSFALSENDLAALQRLLRARQDAPDGMQVLGWYHSHTRGGIHLSEEDLAVYNRFFPHPWQVALVLHPEKFGPVMAGFFFRAPDGAIHAESSYQEFEVLPTKAARAAAAAGSARESSGSSSAAVFVPSPTGTPAPRSAEDQLPMPGKTPGRAPDLQPAAPVRILAPEDGGGAEEKLGEFLKRLEPRRSRRRRWVAGAVLCLAAFWLGYAARPLFEPARGSPSLSLRAYEQQGQLRIEWDRAAAPVLHAQSATLEIREGGEPVRIPLDREHLLSGGATYARRTAEVDVRLRLSLPDGVVEEVTRFVGPLPVEEGGR